MHELSVAHAVVATVTEALPGRTVLGVRLRIGVLAGTVPQALDFAWEIATAGTPLAGSALHLEREPVAVRCLDCAAGSDQDGPPPWRCPACGGRVLPLDATAGRAMEVVSVEVDDEPAGTGEPRIGTGEPRIGTGEPRIGTGEPRIGAGAGRGRRSTGKEDRG
jgi:hydrogenase nickel incorporation protein HypA/HybF